MEFVTESSINNYVACIRRNIVLTELFSCTQDIVTMNHGELDAYHMLVGLSHWRVQLHRYNAAIPLRISQWRVQMRLYCVLQ